MDEFDGAPLIQNHLENVIAQFQQKVLEFSVRTLENMRRVALVSSHLANDFEAIGYLEGIKIQIETLTEGIKDLEIVENGLSQTVEKSNEIIKLRHAKILELTETLNVFNRTLRSPNSNTNLNIVNAVGGNMARYAVNMPYVPSPSTRSSNGGPVFPK
jgi:hypothetical protein